MARVSLVRAVLLSASFAFGAHSPAVETTPEPEAPVGKLRTAERQIQPDISAASDEPGTAMKGYRLDPALKVQLWAAEPMLANPVAFAFDEQGRVFIAETYRYRTSTLDIRDYLWTLEDDMAARTIEDRLAMMHKAFGAEGVEQLSREGELVRLVEDRDGDGVADHSAIYADGFRTPLDGIASGVLARRGSVWFTNIPSLWRFEGMNAQNQATKRTELLRGFGVRFGFTGHDLHGLAFGPDGKLYFSIGDRGAHVPTKEGGVVAIPDTGGVFRCNPDGTEFELVMTGLRNPQELVFTENGDLFTGDNDCDHGDMERFVHIVEDGDSGWSVGYQHAPLGKAGPWNLEKMWVPRWPEQPAHIIPPICNVEDGPSGVAYYPGTGLSPKYAGHFFICHFKGSITRSGIQTYTLKPAGASYAIADSQPFLRNALPTDIAFGPDGRFYWSDWAEGWPKSKRGRIYAVSAPEHANDPLIAETQKLIRSDYTKKSADELAKLLGHADWRVRLEAQFTLAERGRASLAPLTRVATRTDSPELARRHALWGLGQLARTEAAALDSIRPLAADQDAEIRAQAAKLLGDHRVADAFALLVKALGDESARVRFFAAQSLGKLARPEATAPLLALLRENDDADLYLRHAAVVALARCRNLPELEAAARSPHRAERLGVLLAYRRLAHPAVAQFLLDDDPFLVAEAARAINDTPIAEALPALARLIEQPSDNDLVTLRVLNANFRLGQPEHAAALGRYAKSSAAPAKMRAEALTHLAAWPKPPARDRIVGVTRPLPETSRDPAVALNAVSDSLPGLLAATTPAVLQQAALETIESLELRSASEALFDVVANSAQPVESRIAALEVLDTFKDARLAEAVRLASASSASKLRLAALPIAARLTPDDAAPVLAELARSGGIAEQQAAFKALAKLKHPTADKVLAEQLRQLKAGALAPAVELELIDAATQREDKRVRDLLAERDTALAASGSFGAFRVALAGGGKDAGKKLFTDHPILACARCHKVGGDGGDAGPDLSTMGATYTREYLLEAIVNPGARIAPGFETVVATMTDGSVRVGVVAEENDVTLSLTLPDNTTLVLPKTDIAKRETAPSSMPDVYGHILTKAELRDLVEYLATLNVKPATEQAPRALRNIRAELDW